MSLGELVMNVADGKMYLKRTDGVIVTFVPGYVPNGNCQGNGLWTPPNGNWWEWYSAIGQSAWHNSGSYDGAGGTTYANNPVSVGYNYDGYYLAADEIGGGEYHRNYRNCNCGAFNCRTNCNCNCDCDCNCACCD